MQLEHFDDEAGQKLAVIIVYERNNRRVLEGKNRVRSGLILQDLLWRRDPVF